MFQKVHGQTPVSATNQDSGPDPQISGPEEQGPHRILAWVGGQQSKPVLDSDICFYCNQTGHCLNSCPRRLNGFPKAVNTVGDVYNSELDDQEESEVAALSARGDRLFDYMAEKSGKSVYPLKEDPQQTKGDGAVHFLG